MVSRVIYFWKRAPFIRMLLPFMAGIIFQWHLQLPLTSWMLLLSFSVMFIGFLFIIPLFRRFKLGWLDGTAFILLLVSFGALLAWYKDIRHDKKWFANYCSGNPFVIVTLDEPLVEKSKSLKANAEVNYVICNGGKLKVNGKIILYLKKEDSLPALDYGSTIIFHKPLQEIRNAGNPGGFDFKRYSLFQQVTHQVYLKTGEFKIIDKINGNDIKGHLYSFRKKLLNIFRNNIKGDKELGLSEALLIGYKDDLDKSLVQSYSNTGVVHIIAISGMHLALIYWLLNLLLQPMSKSRKWRWLKPIIAVIVLWLFSLLTGASASVLRAAVMFSFIVVADSLSRKASVYNTLAASAFCLLCYNPYWLWDVGFQLSYAAVLSIVIFMQPIYNLLYFKNKLLDHTWKLNAVTLAAQILTTPLSIYHFHQFPVYFFLTNLIAVPLSSVIVLGEILLCAVSFIPFVALLTGRVLTWLIRLMNDYVGRIESLPGSLWDSLQISSMQVIILFLAISGISFWLLEKLKAGLIFGLIALLVFFAARSFSFIAAQQQQKIVVYNVPQRRAIDFIRGRNYVFYGDSEVETDDFVRNFYLEPSRVANRITAVSSINELFVCNRFINFREKRIVLVDSAFSIQNGEAKFDIDFLVISKNPKLYVAKLQKVFNIKEIVFDGSVPFWKLTYWKRDCDSLHIPYHDVSEKGAFVMTVN